MLYPLEQSNKNPFKSPHRRENFIGWGYVDVPDCFPQSVLSFIDGFVPDLVSTLIIGLLLIVILKNVEFIPILYKGKLQGRGQE